MIPEDSARDRLRGRGAKIEHVQVEDLAGIQARQGVIGGSIENPSSIDGRIGQQIDLSDGGIDTRLIGGPLGGG